ncbi:MAG TPA: hypothetical protein PLO43_05180, partial [Chlamydiales bacterium]|nr:hypothetical protein [Chlamydiales bacterium]
VIRTAARYRGYSPYLATFCLDSFEPLKNFTTRTCEPTFDPYAWPIFESDLYQTEQRRKQF